MTDGKWTYNYGDSEFWDCDEEFDTKEEAIKAGREGAAEYANDYLDEEDAKEFLENGCFDVGQITKASFSIDGDEIIENIQDQFSEQCGDSADYWFEYPRFKPWSNDSNEQKDKILEAQKRYKEQVSILEERLHDVIDNWLTEIGEQPNFFSIECIKIVKVKDND